MKKAPIPSNEKARLAALKRYRILDTKPEKVFDQITALAAQICEAKISLVSLVDEGRQWFKSRYGLEATETPRDISYCGHAIHSDEIFEVPDSELSPDFCDNPLFLNPPHVRFYAGAPLITPDGQRIGTLCVIDDKPKTLTKLQRESIKVLAMQVVSILEVRTSEQILDNFFNISRDMMCITSIDGIIQRVNSTFTSCLDYQDHELIDKPFLNLIHPGDFLAMVQVLGKLAQGKNTEKAQFRAKCKDQTYKLLELSATADPVAKIIYIAAENITEKQLLESSLHEAQQIARTGSWYKDLRSRTLSWTKQTYMIFEVDESTVGDELQKKFISRIHPDDLSLLERLRERSEKYGEDYTVDIRIQLDGGKRVKFLQAIAKVNKDSTGVPIGVSGTFRDRTLDVESENKYKFLMETITEGLILQDPEGTIVEFNKAALRILALSTDELLGSKSIDPKWKSITREGYEFPNDRHPSSVARNTGQEQMGTLMGLLLPDNETRWLQINAMPMERADGRWVVSTVSDITALVQAVEDNRFILDSLGIGTWKYNPTLKSMIWDRSMYQLYGIHKSSEKNDYETWLDSLAPESRASAPRDLELAIQCSKDFDTTFEIITKNGQRKFLGGKGKVVRNEEGQPTAMYGINWDRTTEIALEKNLHQERAKALQNAKLASLGEMSAGIAHEINNPLAIIVGSIPLLQKYKSENEKFNTKIAAILSSAGRIEKIVKGLSKFSRSSGGGVYRIEKLSSIIEESILLTSAKSKRHLTPIRTDIRCEGHILCDQVEIEQVLINLINNGIDAAKKQTERWVNVNLFEEHDQIVLHVCDSGPGLSIEAEERLFQPFFTTKPIGEGTGLGLSICKGILDQHKASIEVKNEHNHTCFEVRFKNAKELPHAA